MPPTDTTTLPELGAVARREALLARELSPVEVVDAGIPVTVKDNLLTAGIRSTLGSLLFADFVPDRDAVIVARVRAAGAAIVGKTDTCEMGWKCDAGNRVFGPTTNP